MSAIRRSGWGSMAAEVLSEIGIPGHAARRPRRGARLRCERLVAVVVVRVQVQGSGASLYRLARLGGEFFGRTGYRGMFAIAVERCLQQAVILRQGRLLLRRRLHADGSAGILPYEVLFNQARRRRILGSSQPQAMPKQRQESLNWGMRRPLAACDPSPIGFP